MVNKLGTTSSLLAQLARNKVQTPLTSDDAILAGHKRTEVGVIPVDWKVVSFGEVFKFLQTGSNSRADLSDHGDVHYVHYGDLHTKRHPHFLDLFSDRLPKISSEKIKRLPRLQDGDVIISDASEDFEGIGVSVELRNTNEHLIVGGLHTIALRDEGNRIAKGYGGYLTAIAAVKHQLIRNSTGTTVYGLSKTNLSKTYFPLPPTLPEQRAIAKALGDTDALLAALDALIAKQERVKRGVLEELLGGERRLAGFSAAAASGGDGEWKTIALGELADITTGSKNNQDKVNHGIYPFYVRSQHVERIDSYSYDTEAILVPGEGNIGSIFHYIDGKFEVHQRVYKIDSFHEGCYGKYIYWYMLLHFGRHALEHSVKATVDSLRLPTFENFNISLPPLPEQRAIAEVLSALDAGLAAVRARRAKVARVKAGMMEGLLTGRVRLV